MEVDHQQANHEFARSICTICFKGLNPIIEDIQSISICGHVFHEFCLQQWIESLPAEKKKPCPVCKQKFSQKYVSRLYLQWIEDQPCLPPEEKFTPSVAPGDNAVSLRGKLVKLGEKLTLVDKGLEQQQHHLRELKEELSIVKDLAVKEATLKMEAVRENSACQEMLKVQMEELAQSNAKRSKLQDRILALEKELAANELASNLDLDEEEITKIAYAGREDNSKVVIDILRKSLIIRNWSYKQLMTQCDLLGREEQNSQKRLAKATKKMEKLKERLKELKRALEDKDNEILRSSKKSKRISMEDAHESGCKLGFDHINNCRSKVKKEYADGTSASCCTGVLPNHPFDANGNGVFPQNQNVSNLKTLGREIIHMEGKSYFQTVTDTGIGSKDWMPLQYSKKPVQLSADEQIAPHMGMLEEIIEDRKPILYGVLGSSHTDEEKYSGLQLPNGVLRSVVGRSMEKWFIQGQSETEKPSGMGQMILVGADGREEQNKSQACRELSLLEKPSQKVQHKSRSKCMVSWMSTN